MSTNEIIEKLKALGSDQIKQVLLKHGAREPFFGVKVGDMKPLLKGTKGNNQLAIGLYNTGIADAMYLAGLMADGSKMTPDEIRNWAREAYWPMLSEYTVPWIATENAAGYELAKEWIESEEENIASAGWSTFSSILSVWPDEKLDKAHLRALLSRVENTIHQSPDRVRYVMNGFIIALGSYASELREEALSAAARIGKVKVNMHGTACKVPLASEYILKVTKMGRTVQKRKTAKC